MNNNKLILPAFGLIGVFSISSQSTETSQSEDCSQSGVDERPNILFILSDDHTSQAWGVYGGILSQYVKNENIRRLAAEGCVLENCFCTNSISVPSRASILTGAYSHRNGAYTLADALPHETDNIALQLQKAGYQTALFGKWHLKKQPSGFDVFRVLTAQGSYRDPVLKSADDWVDDGQGQSGVAFKGFSTDVITDLTIDQIRKRDKTKPFMICCHYKATHGPWDYPERLQHLYDDTVFPEPENLMEFGPEKSGRTFEGNVLELQTQRWEAASEELSRGGKGGGYPDLPFSAKGLGKEETRRKTYQKLIKDFLRCGATIDENIGRLLQTLDDEKLSQNTVVIYVSDQGFFLGEHGFFDKRIMYDEALRMPFVIRYPKEVPMGTRNSDMILNIDFAALLADYAGASAPNLSQGRSFRSNLIGKTPNDWRQDIYYRYWTQHQKRPAHFGIRNHSYKLIFFYGDPLEMTGSEKGNTTPAWEFYDLKNDPNENRNAYNNPEYQNIIKDMKQRLLEIRESVGDTDAHRPRMQEIIKTYYN